MRHTCTFSGYCSPNKFVNVTLHIWLREPGKRRPSDTGNRLDYLSQTASSAQF